MGTIDRERDAYLRTRVAKLERQVEHQRRRLEALTRAARDLNDTAERVRRVGRSAQGRH